MTTTEMLRNSIARIRELHAGYGRDVHYGCCLCRYNADFWEGVGGRRFAIAQTIGSKHPQIFQMLMGRMSLVLTKENSVTEGCSCDL